jgi:glycyl-tRNA synthetase beta chain
VATFLLEIGLEEIPARMIAPAQTELERRVEELLRREKLADDGFAVRGYSTPRRLAVIVDGVLAQQSDQEEELVGPSVKIAFKDGQPTPAAIAFAKKAGIDVSATTTVTNSKGEYIAARVTRKGRAAADVLTAGLPKEIASIYWAKSMYWRPGKPERFVRPMKWLLALLDQEVVPVEFAGVRAGYVTYGHRILHGNDPVLVDSPANYLAALTGAKVNADVPLRRHTIRKALDAATRTVAGMRWREDEPLVDTVTHLTEWPSVVLGSFEMEYLSLPEEVLVTVMRDHQKYFAVEDAEGELAPHFLAALNTETDSEGEAIIRHGNERVLRARFNDARFFWDFDQKIPLEDRVEMLKSVTFQKDLGSYFDKTQANMRIAAALAADVLAAGGAVDVVALQEAALLAKADLTTELVKEFTELQGVVGGLYAKAQGKSALAPDAIYSQYMPASVEDAIPQTVEGQLLGIADRIGTIVEMFGIGLEPTGSRDPFALRRAANGVVKILAESQLPLTLVQVMRAAGDTNEKVELLFAERLAFYLRDVRGFAYDVVNAVVKAGGDDVRDAIARAEALTVVRGSEDFLAVSAAFKRMSNILGQAREKNEAVSARVDEALFADPAERDLATASAALAIEVEELRRAHRYRGALEKIATLRPRVDVFFDKVMVMAPEANVRGNRLALVSRVLGDFSRIADFSEIVAG